MTRTATRVVSLVPSLTAAVVALGCRDRLVAATRFCPAADDPATPVPAEVPRLRGTKNPEVAEILALEPDLVLANQEENRPREINALRDAGVEVLLTFPRRVADVGPLLEQVADALGVPAAATALLRSLDEARERAEHRRPRRPLATLTLVWRRPWMGLGPDTYADDLLRCCGFANVLAGWAERYPRLEEGLLLGPEVVLLPSEPYAFDRDDVPAVRRLVGEQPRLEFVDGRLLTWHGPDTRPALEALSGLAARLTSGSPGA